MCQLAQVSRAEFYRYLGRSWRDEEEIALRSAVQNVVIEHKWRYGYRRRSHRSCGRTIYLPFDRRGYQPRERSRGAASIYLNLANRMTLSGPNQLWVADITYIRLVREFVYLAVVLDAFSRKVIGWALGRSLKAQLAVCAPGAGDC